MGKHIPFLISVCFIISFFPFSSEAQNDIYISGQVVYASKTPVANVNIIVHRTQDSLAVAFTQSNQQGKFAIQYQGQLPVFISASALGYERMFKKIDSADSASAIQFVLNRGIKVLEEVIVTYVPKIQVRGDTTSYKLSSFLAGNERNLEEALAKLPGFSINEQGQISVNGRAIQKLLLEGDDLMSTNYTALSKNMSPGSINQVQVLDKYLNDRMMKGIEKTDDIAVNLTFKKEFKNVFFGDILAEGGEGKYYNGVANGIFISKPVKAYLMGSANNIGRQSSFMSYSTFNPQSTLAIPYNPMLMSKKLVDIASSGIPMIEENRTVFNNTHAASLNLLQNFSKKLNMKFNISVTGDKNTQTSQKHTELFFNKDTIAYFESNDWITKPKTAEGQIEAEYYFSDKSRLKYIGKGATNVSNEASHLLFNSDRITQNLSSKVLSVSNQLSYTFRPSSKNALIVEAAQFSNNRPQDFYVNGYDYSSVFSVDANTAFFQSSKNPVQYLGGQARYYTNSKKATIILNAGYDRYQMQVVSSILPDLLKQGNQLEMQKEKLYVRADYNQPVSRHLEITSRLGINWLGIINHWQNSHSNKTNSCWFLSPNLTAKWTIGLKSRITFGYKYSKDFPNAVQLFDSLIFTDYRTAYRYQYQNYFQSQNSYSLGYRYNDSYNQFTVYINGFYTNTSNSYADNSIINKKFMLSTKYDIPQGSNMTGLVFGSDKFVSSLSGTIRFSGSAIRSKYVNNINNTMSRDINFWTLNGKLNYFSGFNGIFNFNTHFMLLANLSTVKLPDDQFNNQTYNYKGFLQTNFKFNKVCYIQSTVSYYQWFGKNQKQRPVYFLDASFLGNLIKDKLTVSASLQNALNQQSIHFNNITDYSNSLSTYHLLPRMFVAGIKYTF